MDLYPDQIQALAKIEQAFASGSHGILLVAATGFGKTHSAVEFIDRKVAAGESVWFVAHLSELLDDTARRLDARHITYGWIRSGHDENLSALVQLVSIKTAVRRLKNLKRPDLIIIDECDLACAPGYQQLLDHLQRPRMLGLTGSPCRSDGRPMQSAGFDTLIRTPDTIDLIESQPPRLSRLRMWSFVPPPGLSAVRRRGRDVDGIAAGRIMSDRVILSDNISHWRRLCAPDGGLVRPTAIFCSSVADAEATAEEWQQAGFRALAVSGGSPDSVRREALEGLRAGRLDAVACADLWIAGVDVARIAAVLCRRRTESLRVWLQMVGRGLRLCREWPDCYLLDMVGNITQTVGSPLQRRMAHWSLDSPSGLALPPGSPPLAPVVVCQVCRSCWIEQGVCQECGHRNELRLPHGPRIVEGQLLELDPRKAIKPRDPPSMNAADVRKQRSDIFRQAKNERWNSEKILNALKKLATDAGYRNPSGWAFQQIKIRQQYRKQA